ncbi:uncharacterized protein LOC115816210 [Chanos chanos]|uniref:Uncharacterized protein LOC115816210 n=1 Tax=Chanos chanos TaxID=29144 RepID=A0A6J2VSI7_CHACN|nr:uncharacterized protein LOC115816210 [Chanos chanos]
MPLDPEISMEQATEGEAGGLFKIVQPRPTLLTEVGKDVTLTCFHPEGQINKVMWFKQAIGQKPLLIADSYHHSQPSEYRNNFKEGQRFTATRGHGSFNLSISKTETSDSATYYCAVSFINIVSFGDGAVLIIKGPDDNRGTILQEPVLELIQPGASVTLQCKILTEICAGEHSVYWFRHGSGESHPGIIYTHGNRSDQCEKRSEAGSPTLSCVYHLPKKKLSLSDAGTYYCAVATCGEILFGTGISIKTDGDNMRSVDDQTDTPGLQGDGVTELNYIALRFSGRGMTVKTERGHEETLYTGLNCME